MDLHANRRILFVDDDDLVRDMYRRLLGRQFEVSIADSADEAIDILSTDGPFAVIVSDFRMPRTNGVDLLRHVRQSWPDMSRILMTGHLEISEMADDIELATVIGKPCPYPEMIAALTRGLDAYNCRMQI